MTVKNSEMNIENKDDSFHLGLKFEAIMVAILLFILSLVYFIPKLFSYEVNLLFLVGLFTVIIVFRFGNTFLRFYLNCFFPNNFEKEHRNAGILQIVVLIVSLGAFDYLAATMEPDNVSSIKYLFKYFLWIAFLSPAFSMWRLDDYDKKSAHFYSRSEVIIAPKKMYWILIVVYYLILLTAYIQFI